jgi:formiminotetrahydrofolate cyclodeaminase
MVARCSPTTWAEAAGVSAQALAIRDRAAQLARTDADAWHAALEALADSGDEGGADRRNHELERKLDLAAAAPLEIAQLAADLAELAAAAAERCEGSFRADAAAAAALAAGAARAAAHLVEVNLTVRVGDERLTKARASHQAASESADRVLTVLE